MTKRKKEAAPVIYGRRPELECVECGAPKDMLLKRRSDKFAVPLCMKHYGDTEHIVLTHDDVQGFYYIAADN